MASSIKGVSRLRMKLRRMPDEVTKEVRYAVARAGNIVLDEMRRAAPERGAAQALESKVSGKDALTVKVGFVGKRAKKRGFKGIFFEFGTKPHAIRTRARKKRGRVATSLVSSAGVFFGKSVRHPGMRRKPWLFPSWRRKSKEVLPIIRTAINKALARVAGLGGGGE